MYCYRDRHSEWQDTPALRRVNDLNAKHVINWASNPAQRIGPLHSQKISDDSPVHVDDRDVNEAHEDDASYLSVSSTDISESAHRSVRLCTIVLHPPRGGAKEPANRISLLTKFFSPQNRLFPLDVIHHQTQAEDDPLQGVHVD